MHDMSFEQRLARIDLTKVMAHVAEDTGLEGADLARAEDLYRKFLTLKGRYPNQVIVPPQIVDHVWHAHITFTRQYMADCEMLFGGYLHHEPRFDDTTADYENGTVRMFANDFGLDIYRSGFAPGYLRAGGCN